jgi:hypothetical protein
MTQLGRTLKQNDIVSNCQGALHTSLLTKFKVQVLPANLIMTNLLITPWYSAARLKRSGTGYICT